MEEFRAWLRLNEESGIEQVRLLGGEPSAHPLFADFVRIVVERGSRLLVFTNGLIGEEALAELAAIPGDRLTVLMNVRRPEEEKEEDRARIARSLRALGTKVKPGFTIDSPSPELDFLLGIVEEFGTSPRVRLGLAHPDAEGRSSWLHPKHYASVGRKIAAFAREARKRGIEAELDCGFVPCMFADAPDFLKSFPAESLGRACGPIPDILPDSTAVACYPLAALARFPLAEFARIGEIRTRLKAEIARRSAPGIYRECRLCGVRREGDCQGGCIAIGMKRLRGPRAFAMGKEAAAPDRAATVATAVSAGPPWVLPYVDAPMEFWRNLDSSYRGRIKQVYLPLPGRLLPTGRPPQNEARVEKFLDESPFPISILINPIVLESSVEDSASIVTEALLRLRERRPIADITLASVLLAGKIREALPDVPAHGLRPHGYLQALTGAPDGGPLLHHRTLQSRRPGPPRSRGPAQILRGKDTADRQRGMLPDCAYRVQHFYEMASGRPGPASLCAESLSREPWRRLTGAWVLPPHLGLYEGLYDELKLSGRSTLRDTEKSERILGRLSPLGTPVPCRDRRGNRPHDGGHRDRTGVLRADPALLEGLRRMHGLQGILRAEDARCPRKNRMKLWPVLTTRTRLPRFTRSSATPEAGP